MNDDGTYNVFYDDGDRDERVSLARITVIDSSKPKSTSITSEALPKISQSSSTRSNTHSSTSTETSTSQGVVRLLASMMASARDSSEGTRGISTSSWSPSNICNDYAMDDRTFYQHKYRSR